jgi:hypothetical protein
MPSKSLIRWRSQGRNALDQIQNAHAAVGGSLRGRRYATLHINHAYLVLVSSHFQRFCRDLHTESIDCLCGQGTSPDPRRDVLRIALNLNRQLDARNPTPSAIGADFNRFNLNFWSVVKSQSPVYNEIRQQSLEQMNKWRNAIAHQDFASHGLRPEGLTLTMVRNFRKACDQLAGRFDAVLAAHLATMTGVAPW